MSDNNKAKVGIHMKPELIAQVDAEHSLHGYTSRSAFVCAATEFYLGYLHSENDTDYMSKTAFDFLEGQVAKLDAKICRQLFRLCVEISMVTHITEASLLDTDDEVLKKVRQRCVRDVKNTIGNVQYDKIFRFQHKPCDEEQEMVDDEI